MVAFSFVVTPLRRVDPLAKPAPKDEAVGTESDIAAGMVMPLLDRAEDAASLLRSKGNWRQKTTMSWKPKPWLRASDLVWAVRLDKPVVKFVARHQTRAHWCGRHHHLWSTRLILFSGSVRATSLLLLPQGRDVLLLLFSASARRVWSTVWPRALTRTGARHALYTGKR